MFCVVGVYQTSAINTVDHDIVLDRLRHWVSILGSALDLCLRDLFLWLPLSSAPLLLFLHMVQEKFKWQTISTNLLEKEREVFVSLPNRFVSKVYGTIDIIGPLSVLLNLVLEKVGGIRFSLHFGCSLMLISGSLIYAFCHIWINVIVLFICLKKNLFGTSAGCLEHL